MPRCLGRMARHRSAGVLILLFASPAAEAAERLTATTQVSDLAKGAGRRAHRGAHSLRAPADHVTVLAVRGQAPDRGGVAATPVNPGPRAGTGRARARAAAAAANAGASPLKT